MQQIFRLATIGVVALSLGGCQSLKLPGWSFKKQRSEPQQSEPSELAYRGILDDAKTQLREGNLSTAIALFRVARQSEDNRAEAYNGMAVAYAKLGRTDLADRYFRAALKVDPEGDRYAANLLRLQRQVMLAQADEAPGTAVRVAQAPEELAAAQPTRPASGLRGNATRLARGIVHIQTEPEQDSAAKPAMRVVYLSTPRAVEPAGMIAEPAIPAAAPTTTDKSKSYPVRIVLDE